jgi:hypothetical protein
MHLHPISISVMLFARFFCLPTIAEDYQMKTVPLDDPRWGSILALVNDQSAARAAAAGEEKMIEIVQFIEGSSYLARMNTPPKVLGSIAQSINWISGRPVNFAPPGEWSTIRLDLPPGSSRIADGEKMVKSIEDTGQLFEYTTPLGANATVKVFRLAGMSEEFRQLTKSEFLERLKAGKSWTVSVPQITKLCGFCRGAKVLSGAPCPQCKGDGGDIIERIVNIMW